MKKFLGFVVGVVSLLTLMPQFVNAQVDTPSCPAGYTCTGALTIRSVPNSGAYHRVVASPIQEAADELIGVISMKAIGSDVTVQGLQVSISRDTNIPISQVFQNIRIQDGTKTYPVSLTNVNATGTIEFNNLAISMPQDAWKEIKLIADVVPTTKLRVAATVVFLGSSVVARDTSRNIVNVSGLENRQIGGINIESNYLAVSKPSVTHSYIYRNDGASTVATTFAFTLTNHGNETQYISKIPGASLEMSINGSVGSSTSASSTILSVVTNPSQFLGDTSRAFIIPAGAKRTFVYSGILEGVNGFSGQAVLKINQIRFAYDDIYAANSQLFLTRDLENLVVVANLSAGGVVVPPSTRNVTITSEKNSSPVSVTVGSKNVTLFTYTVSASSTTLLNGFAIGGNAGGLPSLISNVQLFSGTTSIRGIFDKNNGFYAFTKPIELNSANNFTKKFTLQANVDAKGTATLTLGGLFHDYGKAFKLSGLGLSTRAIEFVNNISVVASKDIVASGSSVVFTFVTPSDAFATKFRLTCPYGVRGLYSVTNSTVKDICANDLKFAKYTPEITLRMYNSGSTTQNVIARYDVSASSTGAVGKYAQAIIAVQPDNTLIPTDIAKVKKADAVTTQSVPTYSPVQYTPTVTPVINIPTYSSVPIAPAPVYTTAPSSIQYSAPTATAVSAPTATTVSTPTTVASPTYSSSATASPSASPTSTRYANPTSMNSSSIIDSGLLDYFANLFSTLF